jgi:hypothetical protein
VRRSIGSAGITDDERDKATTYQSHQRQPCACRHSFFRRFGRKHRGRESEPSCTITICGIEHKGDVAIRLDMT